MPPYPSLRRRSLLTAGLVLAAGAGTGARPGLAAPAVKKALPLPRPKLIALDPGHGGADPGALGVAGTQEKGVVFTVARDLAATLQTPNPQTKSRYRVMLTRSADSFVPLRERVARAQEAKADLFLSIHADSHPDPEVRGASVYTLSDAASDREAAALAQRENRDGSAWASRLANQPDTVAKTLVAMAQRSTGNDSTRFAETIVQTFARNGIRLLPHTHREAGFAVLTSPDMPATLVELGYLSNPADERLLTVPQHQTALARALRASIDTYFAAGSATRKA